MRKIKWNVARFVLVVAVLAAMFGAAMPAAAQGAPTLYLDPAELIDGSVIPGDTFNIDVVVDTNGNQMRLYEFGLTYDNTKIDVTSVVEGPFMKDWAIAQGASTTSATGGWNTAGNPGTVAPAGYAVAGAPSAGGVVGTGVVAVITIAVVAPGGGHTLDISPGAFLGDENAAIIPGLTTEGSTLWLGVLPPKPDLIVETISVLPDPGDANKYQVEAKVKNQGAVDAGASTAQVKVDSVVFEDLAVGPLVAGASQTVVTVGQATLTPDSDSIGVCADSGNVVDEISESNNCGSTTYSLIADSDEVATDVNADLKKYISLRAPADVPHTDWLLNIGANTKERLGADGLGVKSNASWSVTAADEDATNTNGFMAQYNGTTFGVEKLESPHHVVQDGYNVTLPTAATIAIGSANTTPVWQDFPIVFSQWVNFSDKALDATWYHIVVTFAGTTSF